VLPCKMHGSFLADFADPPRSLRSLPLSHPSFLSRYFRPKYLLSRLRMRLSHWFIPALRAPTFLCASLATPPYFSWIGSSSPLSFGCRIFPGLRGCVCLDSAAWLFAHNCGWLVSEEFILLAVFYQQLALMRISPDNDQAACERDS